METSYRVLKMKEFGGDIPTVYYKLDCSCGCDNHLLTFSIEHDMNTITLIMEKRLEFVVLDGKHFISSIFKRIKAACRVLFFGHLELEGTTILNDEEHIQSFINALEEGKVYVKEYIEKREEEISNSGENEENKI